MVEGSTWLGEKSRPVKWEKGRKGRMHECQLDFGLLRIQSGERARWSVCFIPKTRAIPLPEE